MAYLVLVVNDGVRGRVRGHVCDHVLNGHGYVPNDHGPASRPFELGEA